MIDALSFGTPDYGFGPAPVESAQRPAPFQPLAVLGGVAAQTAQQAGFVIANPVGGAAPRLLASGSTLLGAQQAGSSTAGSGTAGSGKSGAKSGELNEEEQAQVDKLKKIDAKVRAHERAHAAVGGAHAGAPSYSYTRGPDGQMYAVSGEVAIDISPENDPHATLQKATQVAAAALAPADPSGADRAVAAAAAALRLEALAQIRQQEKAEQAEKSGGEASQPASAASPAGQASRAYEAAIGRVIAQAGQGLGQGLGRQVGISV